jgi:hypothetical protein
MFTIIVNMGMTRDTSQQIVLYNKYICVWTYINLLDVCGSMHRSVIHIEIANKMQQFTKIYYSTFI